MHVLVVENDEALVESLVGELRRGRYGTTAVNTGSRALELYDRADLILLDLKLPDVDGIEVCRTIRSVCDIPIIAFTECATELDRVLVLQAGSDDCLDKPYGLRELMARIDAVMRRARRHRDPHSARQYISHGSLHIDAEAREVHHRGEPIKVTRKEFDLLYHLASHPGVVISRKQLMAEVWDDPVGPALGLQASRTIDTHVSSLRSKLRGNRYIHTVRGIGFRFVHS